MPKTPAEREKTLSDLYALLATADDEDTAKAITDAIERVWLHSGSATIDVLMERSIKAMSQKKVDLALKLLDSVVDLAPDYTEAWNRRAYVHFVRKDTERALGDLRRALALDPNHFKALDGLAPDPARDRPEEAGAQGVPAAARRAPLLVGCQAGGRGARARGRRPGDLSAFALLPCGSPTKPLTTRGPPPLGALLPVATLGWPLLRDVTACAGVDGCRC